MDNAAALAAVNGRLKKGEGWIGYRFSKNSHGERVQSKSLYFSFYQNGKQKFILTKTNDPEQAYRDLLEARGQVRDGARLLPQEVSKLRYEDLRQILVDHYREHFPGSHHGNYGGWQGSIRGVKTSRQVQIQASKGCSTHVVTIELFIRRYRLGV